MAQAAAALVLASVLIPAAPAGADGVPVVPAPVPAVLRCTFSTRAPGPGQVIDRRFQEIVIGGSCNRAVKQVPLIFVDGVKKDVMATGVTNPVRFAGLSSVFQISKGPHQLRVVVLPRQAGVRPFVSTWTFIAR